MGEGRQALLWPLLAGMLTEHPKEQHRDTFLDLSPAYLPVTKPTVTQTLAVQSVVWVLQRQLHQPVRNTDPQVLPQTSWITSLYIFFLALHCMARRILVPQPGTEPSHGRESTES